MDFFKCELAAIEVTQQATTAFSPQVQSKIVNGRCHSCSFFLLQKPKEVAVTHG